MTAVEGRTAFITGGARGIGLGIARALTGAGMRVAIADIDPDALDAAVGELSESTDAIGCLLDVRDREEYARARDVVEHRLGPVDVLCNNAGVIDGVHASKTDHTHYEWVMGVNLDGVFNGIHTFLPGMMRRGYGHIVNTSSAAGLVVGDGVSGWLYYASKFGVVGLSEALLSDVGSAGIGVSILFPGPVATGIIEHTNSLRPSTSPPPLTKESGRPGEWVAPWLAGGTHPDDVGRMVLRAVIDNRLYVYTDDILADPIRQRTDALLAAIPSPSPVSGA